MGSVNGFGDDTTGICGIFLPERMGVGVAGASHLRSNWNSDQQTHEPLAQPPNRTLNRLHRFHRPLNIRKLDPRRHHPLVHLRADLAWYWF